jgi:type IV pilus assembly protein PilP
MRENQNAMKSFRILTILAVSLLLAACARTDNFNDLQRFVSDAKATPGGAIEPVPEFEDYEAFTYSAAGFRSPFEVPIRIKLQEGMRASQDVQPNLDRIKEALESYAIAELAMVGMVERKGVYVALVQSTLGEVHRVMPGSYLGRNHGRVVSITDTQVDLIEIVPSGDGGWMERPQTLSLIR